MNSRPGITINNKPSQAQLKDWFENGVTISFTEKDDGFHYGMITNHNGKILKYQPLGEDALLWIESSRFGVYLRNITNYTYTPVLEPIFIDVNSDSPEKIGLIAKDKTFWVNKRLISSRLDYFGTILQSDMQESGKKIDLSQLFSALELEILLLVVNVGNCKFLSFEQTQILLEVAHKISEKKMIEQAQDQIDECIALANKEFLLAVRVSDYSKCTEMLSKGANIDEKFGKYSQDDLDSCSFCGPNDTPLTHAVKKDDEKLVEFVLKNGANIEVFNCGETPLMKAAFHRNEKIVKLLLDAGANPNIKNQRYSIIHTNTDLTAIHEVFLGLREWLLASQKELCIKVVALLIRSGCAGEYNNIANTLSDRGYNQLIRSLFTEIWQAHYNKELENFFSQGAAGGALSTTILPMEDAFHIGRFLDRRSGGRLAQTCQQAEKSAIKERSKNANRLFENYEIRRLVKKYALPDSFQNSFEKGLRNAANNNNIFDLRIFIKYVKNINAKDTNPEMSRTALHWAAIKGNEECCRLLMAANANPDILDAAGEPASKYLNKLTSVYKYKK